MSSATAAPQEVPPLAATTNGSPAGLAKAALRRLALDRLEPTPEAFARAYAIEAQAAGVTVPAPPAGEPPVPPSTTSPAGAEPISGPALARLIERVVRGVERGGRHWTAARKKDSLQRVLEGSRQDAHRLQARLTQLMASWDQDLPDADPELAAEALPAVTPANDTLANGTPVTVTPTNDTPSAERPEARSTRVDLAPWRAMHQRLGVSVRAALPRGGPDAVADQAPAVGPTDPLADRLVRLNAKVQADGATADDADTLALLCDEADRVIAHRGRLVDQLGTLVRELTGSLGDLAENDSWAQGQCRAMEATLEAGLSSRAVRSVGDLLRLTRERQQGLRAERDRAREALKGLLQRMLSELGELGSQTGRFHESVGRYADVIERADSLESLTGAVREMVEESRTVASLVQQTQQRLHAEHRRARELGDRVSELEGELQRLSAEVATDPLTQVANRRGMAREFEIERERHRREGLTLCVGLIDIDNFKKLNDELGHAAGDIALKSLAQAVRGSLRPADRLARFGGEEFVVLLPATGPEEAQQVLTRVQRALSGALFMHESRPVFVTFSAGVTAYRDGETLDAALERADVALYDAKRSGKNRTCMA
jgi:diguanylate cyclase